MVTVNGITLAGTAVREALSFEALLERHQRMVLRTAWRLLGRLEDAQDVAQEVFLRLHRHLSRIDLERGVESWLYRTTVNVCYDALRARKGGTALEEMAQEPPVEAGQLSDLEQQERRRLMHQALRHLPEKERAAVVLREIEGLETAEVARILGSTEVTVRSQVSSAKAKLRQWLGGRAQ